MRILRIGLERFRVPEKVSDRMIGGAISVLRELDPCDFDGGAREYDRAVSIEYECRGKTIPRPRQPGKTKQEDVDGESE